MEASAQKLQIWAFYATKCLFKIWANKAIQNELSVMDTKQNIATKVYDRGYKRAALQCKNKLHKIKIFCYRLIAQILTMLSSCYTLESPVSTKGLKIDRKTKI